MGTPWKSSRGVSLVEALVALAVMAFGMMAVVGTQSAMRQNADVARQRSEATRIAQAALESARGFTDVEAAGGRPAWEGIASQGVTTVTGQGSATRFELRQTVTDSVDPPIKTLRISVAWKDRNAGDENNQEVVLTSVISAAAPGLSGVLATPARNSAVRRPGGRHVSIPFGAREMGNGSSAFQPRPGGAVVWVFNNLSGLVTGVCTVPVGTPLSSITTEMIAGCSSNTQGVVLSGFVRFIRSGSGAVNAGEAEDPPGPPLNLDVTIALSSTGHPDSPVDCFDDAPETSSFAKTRRYVAYHCLVRTNTGSIWSGTSEVVPLGFSDISDGAWPIGNGDSSQFKVCRYTLARNEAEVVPNDAHPRAYTGVSANLLHQNFLIIRADRSCPVDVPANPASGNFVDSNTLQHQPNDG